jgi:hypothetical protein
MIIIVATLVAVALLADFLPPDLRANLIERDKPTDTSDFNDVMVAQAEIAELRRLVQTVEQHRSLAEQEIVEQTDLESRTAHEHTLSTEQVELAMRESRTDEESMRQQRKQTCVPLCEGSKPPASPALGSLANPASGCEELYASNVRGQGVFFVRTYTMARTRSEPTKVFCDLDGSIDPTNGELSGGWTLLMKAAESEVFHYDSEHWTKPTVLNPHDLGTGEGDAKFQVFNELEVQEFMAVWPGDHGGSSPPWTMGPFAAPITALQFFTTPRVLDTQPRYRSLLEFNSMWFSSQSGAQQLGVAHETAFSKVRWGYSWNDQNDWSSSDAVGGIGEWCSIRLVVVANPQSATKCHKVGCNIDNSRS